MSALIKEVQPLPDKSSTELITASVTRILQQPGIVRLVIDARKDNIEFWRVVSDDEAAEKSISLHDALRQVTMEEYDPHPKEGEPAKSSHAQLFEMFEILEDAGFTPSHVITGAGPVELREWLPMSRKSKMVCGVPLHHDGTMEKDVLVVCGSIEKDATAAEIEYAVKVTLP